MEKLPYPIKEHSEYKGEMIDAFGLILYSDRNVYLKKVLADDDHWKALHEISGPKWRVFSIRPKSGRYESPNLPPGVFGMMVPIWKEPRDNLALLKKYDLDSTKDLPSLVVYSYSDDNRVLSHSIKLDDSSQEKAYSSLKEAIEVCTNAIEAIASENRDSSEGISAALDLKISSFKSWKKLGKMFDFYKLLKGLVP